MAVLGASRIRRRPWGWSGLVLLAGCAAVALHPTPARPAFPHAAHGADLGLDCTICHDGAAQQAKAGRPPRDTCAMCHEAIDPEKPPERRAAALFTKTGDYRAAPFSRLDPEVRFAHGVHAKAGVTCVQCHGDVAPTAAVPATVRVSKKRCLECHAQRRVRDDCAACHRRWNPAVPPATHTAGWLGTHGWPVRAESDAIADDCSLCHTQSSCAACHQTEPPRSHTHQFREMGHGLIAGMDRERCATCHRADACLRCHQETAPRSHRASWGAPRDNHCLSCHDGQTPGESCSTCHAGTPSHGLATPLPASPPHNPALNCRQCHGQGQPLPHADNGANCVDCHK